MGKGSAAQREWLLIASHLIRTCPFPKGPMKRAWPIATSQVENGGEVQSRRGKIQPLGPFQRPKPSAPVFMLQARMSNRLRSHQTHALLLQPFDRPHGLVFCL